VLEHVHGNGKDAFIFFGPGCQTWCPGDWGCGLGTPTSAGFLNAVQNLNPGLGDVTMSEDAGLTITNCPTDPATVVLQCYEINCGADGS